MVKDHISRLAAPKTWPIRARKERKWIARPMPGPHSLEQGMTLSLILKDVLLIAKTTKEVKRILTRGDVLVDEVVRKGHTFAAGLMDSISIPKINQHFRVLFTKKGKLTLLSISKQEAQIKLTKIIGKTIIRGGLTQINLSDGRNLLVRDGSQYTVGDTLVLDLIKKSKDKGFVKEHLKLEKGSLIYLTGGKAISSVGRVKEVIHSQGLQKGKIIYEIGGKVHESAKEYAFVVGKIKPVINLEVKEK